MRPSQRNTATQRLPRACRPVPLPQHPQGKYRTPYRPLRERYTSISRGSSIPNTQPSCSIRCTRQPAWNLLSYNLDQYTHFTAYPSVTWVALHHLGYTEKRNLNRGQQHHPPLTNTSAPRTLGALAQVINRSQRLLKTQQTPRTSRSAYRLRYRDHHRYLRSDRSGSS